MLAFRGGVPPACCWDRRPGVATPLWEVTGVLYRGGVPSCRQALLKRAAGEENFGPPKPKIAIFLESHVGPKFPCNLLRRPDRRAHSSQLFGLSCCLLLVLLPRLLLLAYQQHCCRAFGSHDGPTAARTSVHEAVAV